jgi:hypothetical protein
MKWRIDFHTLVDIENASGHLAYDDDTVHSSIAFNRTHARWFGSRHHELLLLVLL